MTNPQNKGYDPAEIQKFKADCKSESRNFLFVEEDDDLLSEEYAHFMFVGNHKGQEVIFDAEMVTLRLQYSSVVYETAVHKAQKIYPLYVPMETRDETYKANDEMDEEVELMIMELIEEIEDTEEVQIQESIVVDTNYDFGIGLDISLNVEEVNEDVIAKFVKEYNDGTISLDATLYSFKSEEEE